MIRPLHWRATEPARSTSRVTHTSAANRETHSPHERDDDDPTDECNDDARRVDPVHRVRDAEQRRRKQDARNAKDDVYHDA